MNTYVNHRQLSILCRISRHLGQEAWGSAPLRPPSLLGQKLHNFCKSGGAKRLCLCFWSPESFSKITGTSCLNVAVRIPLPDTGLNTQKSSLSNTWLLFKGHKPYSSQQLWKTTLLGCLELKWNGLQKQALHHREGERDSGCSHLAPWAEDRKYQSQLLGVHCILAGSCFFTLARAEPLASIWDQKKQCPLVEMLLFIRF